MKGIKKKKSFLKEFIANHENLVAIILMICFSPIAVRIAMTVCGIEEISRFQYIVAASMGYMIMLLILAISCFVIFLLSVVASIVMNFINETRCIYKMCFLPLTKDEFEKVGIKSFEEAFYYLNRIGKYTHIDCTSFFEKKEKVFYDVDACLEFLLVALEYFKPSITKKKIDKYKSLPEAYYFMEIFDFITRSTAITEEMKSTDLFTELVYWRNRDEEKM